ncbi:hypothetical protein INR49_031473 [Caranx melampygus]|nr:hypothetical protein INR49_031473 [Caranx melampygus]
MKLVILCLFAVCCSTMASTTSTNGLNKADQRRKLEETLKELYLVNETHKHHDIMLNTPPENIKVQGLDFCNSENNTTTCEACDSHPKVNVQEFFKRLEALIQRGISKLTMG